jgi:hypothetical protein
MPIQLRCGSCDQSLRVPDQLLGKRIRCPKCKTELAVAEPAVAVAEIVEETEDDSSRPPSGGEEPDRQDHLEAIPTKTGPHRSPHRSDPEIEYGEAVESGVHRHREREDERPKQRQKRSKFWRRLVKKVVHTRPVEFVETGVVCHRSAWKTIAELAGMLGLFVGSLLLLAAGPYLVAIELGIVPGKPIPGWAVAVIFLITSVFGLLIMFISGLEMVFQIALWRRDERVILGEEYLQCIVGKEDARLHVPYEVIANLSIGVTRSDTIAAVSRNPRSTGWPVAYIGIDLKKEEWSKDIVVDPGMEQFGFDIVLRDYYDLALDKLFAKLLKRWRHVSGRSARQQDDELVAYRRRVLIGKVLTYLILGATALVCCLSPVLMLGRLLVGGGPLHMP